MAVLKTTSPSPMTSAPSAMPVNARPSSSTSATKFLFLAGNDHRLVDTVVFGNQDIDPLCIRGRHVLADVVRPDRQLTVAAIDEHGQLNRPRAPEIHQRVHRGPRGAAVMDHIVDQDDYLAANLGHVRARAVSRLAQV